MVIDQQLQTGEHHRREARTLESRLLSDQHLDVIRDRDADSVNDFVENPSGVGLVELRCKVGIDIALAVGNVDGAYCCENLQRMSTYCGPYGLWVVVRECLGSAW